MTNSPDDIKFLGRSIVLAWYLRRLVSADDGCSIHRNELPKRQLAAQQSRFGRCLHAGWTVGASLRRIPWGYSELRFGHWSDVPAPFKDLKGKDL